MTSPDHHAEMEAHYAAGRERDNESHLFDIAMAEAKAKLAEEVERNGYPPNAELLIAWGVGAGVRTTFKLLMKEIGDANEELSRLKCEASRQAAERLTNTDPAAGSGRPRAWNDFRYTD